MGSVKSFADELHPILDRLGFRRRGSSWNRHSDNLIDVVNVQLSKSREQIWINLGVVLTDAYEKTWGEGIGRFVSEEKATVRARLYELVTGHDDWWELSDEAAPRDAAAKLQTYGMRFLESMHSLPAMEERLLADRRQNPPKVIALAVVQWKLGKVAEACGALATAQQRGVGAWGTHLEQVARSLGC